MKKIYLGVVLWLGILLHNTVVFASTKLTGNDIIPTKGTGIGTPTSGELSLSSVFVWFKSELTTIVFVLAVCVFVFIGIRMAVARGNPEEFKKAWIHFVYAIVGIFFIFVALGVVRLISNLASNF